VKYVSSKALGVDSHQWGIASRTHIPHPKHHAFFDRAIERRFESIDTEMAESAGKISLGDLREHLGESKLSL
jgi:hypothetical protein